MTNADQAGQAEPVAEPGSQAVGACESGVLKCGVLKLAAAGLIGAIIAWALVDRLPTRSYSVPPVMGAVAPSAEMVAERWHYYLIKMMTSMGFVGAVVAASLLVGESLARRSWTMLAVGVPVGLLLGAAGGALGGGGGYCAYHGVVPGVDTVKELFQPAIADMLNTIFQHAVLWGAMGIGIGCGVSLPLLRLTSLGKGMVAGLLGGVVSATAYVLLPAVLFPTFDTVALLPSEQVVKLALFCLSGTLIGAFVGLAVAPTKKAARASA